MLLGIIPAYKIKYKKMYFLARQVFCFFTLFFIEKRKNKQITVNLYAIA